MFGRALNKRGGVKWTHSGVRDVLDDWVAKFESKYPLVGRVTNGTYNGGR